MALMVHYICLFGRMNYRYLVDKLTSYVINSIGIIFVISNCSALNTPPCDKSRRIFTETSGNITDGPLGSNYTQVKLI